MQKNLDLCKFRGYENLSALSRDELQFVRQIRGLNLRFKALRNKDREVPVSIVHNGQIYVLRDALPYELNNYVVRYGEWLLNKYDDVISRCRFFSPVAKRNVRSLVAAGFLSPSDIVPALLAEDGFSSYLIDQSNLF